MQKKEKKKHRYNWLYFSNYSGVIEETKVL